MICPKCNKNHSLGTLEDIELSSNSMNLICAECFSEKDDSNKEYIEEKERVIIEEFLKICESDINDSEYPYHGILPGIGNLHRYINGDDINFSGVLIAGRSINRNNIYDKVLNIIFGDINIEDLKGKSLTDIKLSFESYLRDVKIDIILKLP